MGLKLPQGSTKNVLFNQFASGYFTYGINDNFEVIEEFDTDDCSELRVEVDGTYVEVKTKARHSH